MKKVVLALLAMIAVISLVACGNKKEERVTTNDNNNVSAVTDGGNTQENVTNDSGNAEVITDKTQSSTDEKKYESIINNYKNALAEYDLEDIDSDTNIEQKYPMVNLSLLMHIARYSSEGVKLTFAFYDVDKNGVNELIVGADNAIGAIYSFDRVSNKPVKIYFQETLERGNLLIYDNGVIFSEGSGGAALHYYEFGKIANDSISYEMIEAIEEEYVEGKEEPTYKNSISRDVLEYHSLDEIYDKYLENTKVVENIAFSEM